MAQEEMRKTPNAQRPTFKVEISAGSATSNLKPQTSDIPWRIVDLIVGGIFIYAGLLKMLSPVRFASDIDNYKILPWTIGVALAFYLPWLEIFCGIALVLRFLYRGALLNLTALILMFIIATVAARVRGLDITCGCFGHASQHWSFLAHIATNVAILAGLLALWFSNRSAKPL
jgi:putative oxidoreductase